MYKEHRPPTPTYQPIFSMREIARITSRDEGFELFYMKKKSIKSIPGISLPAYFGNSELKHIRKVKSAPTVTPVKQPLAFSFELGSRLIGRTLCVLFPGV
ncbi:hypothetical protein CDAR_384661 [Caerostris darwini]|uniref:Uncharacterized protein n=1 Tax=Caerostris darwini TaxID=1538125 RepID=A0AAV4SQA3_9ARAC|nr:hypothetical protein CDAR_384661 [Caerostris darwini]